MLYILLFSRIGIAFCNVVEAPADLTPTAKQSKEQVNLALAVAKTSTASVGKFTKALPKEHEVKKPRGKKRKVC